MQEKVSKGTFQMVISSDTKSLIDQVSHNLIPKISVFSHQPRRLFTMAMIVNVLVGNMFSFLVFRVTFKSSWITKKPLSIIICIDEGLKMVSNTWSIYVIMAAIELEGGKPLAFYTGLTFCKMTHIVSSLMIISRYAKLFLQNSKSRKLYTTCTLLALAD